MIVGKAASSRALHRMARQILVDGMSVLIYLYWYSVPSVGAGAEKKDKAGETTLSDYTLCLQSIAIKTAWYLQKNVYRSMEWN